MLIGLDFDNTLISYDQLFYQAALDCDLIPPGLTRTKNSVRNYLRTMSKEDDWTCLQGKVYGQRILEARPYPHMLETLDYLVAFQIPLYIISHKTRLPYAGPPWDLHVAAINWMEQHGLLSPEGYGPFTKNKIFFEVSKKKKVERIVALECTHFVDDLPEVLDMLPDAICKILFSPQGGPEGNWTVLRNWRDLPDLLALN